MGLLSTITSAAGSLLGGDTIKDVGNIIDNLHTSGEEKEEARQKITEILAKAEQAAQAQVSARWEADMKHGSFLSKNIRPLTLIFLSKGSSNGNNRLTTSIPRIQTFLE